MKILGQIHMIELDAKVIGIKVNKKIQFFYFQNSQMNLFKRYLYQDNWIELEYSDKLARKSQYLAHPITFVYKILAIGKLERTIYFDKLNINNKLSDFLESLDNMMFLDLEMTMPSYNFKGKGAFRTELVQAGLLIANSDGEVVTKYSNYVKPTLEQKLSKRALNFLHLEEEEFESKAIPYSEFYNDFALILNKYNPVVVVYGKNDSIVLNDSYEINYLPSLESKTRYVNLLKLIKTYYELKNDPGLFKLYNIYYGDLNDEQTHDAYDDSYKTYMVFKAFKEDVKTKEKYDLVRLTFNGE